MENLFTETHEMLEKHGKSGADVRWVGEYASQSNPLEPSPVGSWENFKAFSDFSYDAGYGGAEISSGLVIVGDDWWLERGEYDGSEWWEFKSLPKRPDHSTPLRPSDLKERF